MISSFEFQYKGKKLIADLRKAIDISICLRSGDENPCCYFADHPRFETIRMGSFIGSVEEGGPVNHKKVNFAPHGNGTHTECYGHISSNAGFTISNLHNEFFCLAQLVSCTPETNGGDLFISKSSVSRSLKGVEALIIRSLPNEPTKLSRSYSGQNPVFLEPGLGEFLRNSGVRHLLVDLPSVDKESDGGQLANHHGFWGKTATDRLGCTITELIFVPDEAVDGMYLLNLQTANFALDASPSRPIIFPLI